MEKIESTRDIIKRSREVRIRQSLNLYSKNWGIVKIRDPRTGVWIKFDKECMDQVVSGYHGYGMAIYRTMWKFEKQKDSLGRHQWKVGDVKKSRRTLGGNTYSVFNLTCTRQKHDISGVF
jgi:hypothetical protein